MPNSATTTNIETIQGVQQSTGQPSPITKTNIVQRGTCTANGATPVAVAAAKITVDQVVVFSPASLVTSTYQPFPTTIQAGVGFSFASQAGDTNVYNFKVF